MTRLQFKALTKRTLQRGPILIFDRRRDVFFVGRAQVGCIPTPPACQEQGVLQRVPRCGGLPVTLGLPFNGATSVGVGGGKVYVLASKEGLFRVDAQSGAGDRLEIGAECVSDFAANAGAIVVVAPEGHSAF